MERHIQHPVQAVFDAPMLADRMGKALHIGLEARDEEMNLGGGAIADCARALYDADGAEIPPASIAVEIFDLRRIRDEDVPVIRPQKRYQCELQSVARHGSTRLS